MSREKKKEKKMPQKHPPSISIRPHRQDTPGLPQDECGCAPRVRERGTSGLGVLFHWGSVGQCGKASYL